MSLLWVKAVGPRYADEDEMNRYYPHLFGDPEQNYEDEDPDGHGWAANYLAHATKEDPEAGNSMYHDLTWHRQDVPVDEIEHATHEPGDHRVARAKHGYQTGADMPPLLLVHRWGRYQVADGHHRAQAAKEAGKSHVDSFVAQSPHENTPGPDGDDEDAYAPHAKGV